MASVTQQLRRRRSMVRLLYDTHSILDYTFDASAFTVPSWTILPPEVHAAMAELRYKAITAVFSMKSLMTTRNNCYFNLCPDPPESVAYQMHQSSIRRLLDWQEDRDPLDPTFAPAHKIPRTSLHFSVDHIAYGRFAMEYTNRLAAYMAGPFQDWRQYRSEVEHIAFRLMSNNKHNYAEWRAWWNGQFADDMFKWETCLDGLVLPTWEEIIDDVYLMIIDRVEDAQELANSFHFGRPAQPISNAVIPHFEA
ncbi:uncharacterized protein N7515_002022 [Penicillium bovifimosum]|uniref:Uncharacterized protein n=1 Tax=Penicillium bovifimosum TaxID=126998 RepID=A0A9W9L7P2_9EURO|nr:uncharacterized protein N7515_002022 [Penicillium bovifimosum]KAJ5143235.1 hypothetical protein N7515_002022 [Penicillium bovifimosum]